MSIQSIDPATIQAMRTFVNADDKQLKQLAREDARSEFANDPQRKRENKFATMLPVADSLLQGVATSGKLSKKGKAVVKAGTEWAVFMGAVALYNKAMGKVTQTFPALKEFGEEHPVISKVADTTVGVVTGMSAVHYFFKGVNKLRSKVKGFDKAVKTIENLVDDSGVGKAINNGMETFAKKFPKANNVVKKVAVLALPVACVGLLGVYFYDLLKMGSKQDSNYKDLKELQKGAATMLAKNEG